MKSLKRILSLLLAVSALCILFAFEASALTTNCPTCGASCGYNPMPFDLRHECECPNHGVFTEEACEDSEINGDCTEDWSCLCGNVVPGSGVTDHQYSIVIYGEYTSDGHNLYCGYYYAGCTYSIIESHHIGVGGYCTDGCGYHQ